MRTSAPLTPWRLRARLAAAFSFVMIASALVVAATPAGAQAYPKSPITLVIPVAAGDAADVAGRLMAEDLGRQLGVAFVIVNKPGAGAVLGANEVARARKDGHTLLFSVNSAFTFRPVLDPKTIPYDIERDFVPLGLATRTPVVLAVRGDAPWADFAQIVAAAKRDAGGVRVGTAGVGSSGHIAVETIGALTGARITMVPFTGASPAVTSLQGGFVDGIVVSLGAVGAPLRSGALRGLALSSRSPEFPQIPTLTELGYAQDLLGVWMAFFAPSGVAREITDTLVPAIERTVRNPAIGARLLPLGMVQDYRPPSRVTEELRGEYRTVETVAKRAGLIP